MIQDGACPRPGNARQNLLPPIDKYAIMRLTAGFAPETGYSAPSTEQFGWIEAQFHSLNRHLILPLPVGCYISLKEAQFFY